ncbi:MAG: hypothetical protein F6J95_025960 [Leptolyngbya sp. SIO1E4]|nr:hypothetical protein [Leptolyngbya sp. SIO1E4]
MTIDTSNPTDLLRWWHQYQAHKLNQEAELIRNKLLQEMFAIRRRLELSCETQPNAQAFDCETHLAELKRLYALLESLGNRLESPYLQDSLPLALQHTVQPWQTQLPLSTDLPPRWELDPIEHTRLLILFVETLLQHLASATPLPHDCDLRLQHQAELKELTVRVRYETWLPPAWISQISSPLQPLLKTFQLLMQGDYDQDLHPRTLTWVLRWQTQSHPDSSSC